MQMLAAPDARALFERMRKRHLLVVGDVMIDEWIWGTVTRISPEAPVPVVQVTDHSFTLGGAGNVANNLRALDARVTFAGAIGTDAFAHYVADILANEGISGDGLVRVSDRPTTRKTRVVAHNQQVVRADWESTAPLAADDRDRLVRFRSHVCAPMRTPSSLATTRRGCSAAKSSKRRWHVRSWWRIRSRKISSCFAASRASRPTRTKRRRPPVLPSATKTRSNAPAPRYCRSLDCRYVVITRGEHGMSLFGRDGNACTFHRLRARSSTSAVPATR